MAEKSKVIFGNRISDKDYNSAVKSKQKYIKRFGDDSDKSYPTRVIRNDHIGDILGVQDIRVDEEGESLGFDEEKGIIVGNIRMGFGHYRISMAIASAAHALGYTPYWMDLNSYPNTTCTKVISAQNDLYSMGSRISQKSKLFNKFFWEPMNYEGFRKLSYNASDEKNAELMATVFRNVPKDIPVIGTHVWPAGMRGDEVLNPMPAQDLRYVGHYIDHELVSNVEKDCEARVERKKNGAPMRFLLTIGGAGAQKEIFGAIIKNLIPKIRSGEAALYVNVGDYRNVWDDLSKEIPEMADLAVTHFNDWADTRAFAEQALTGEVKGIHAFWHENIFEAVYCTNLLMRSCDVLVTKPSELAFYPVPKLFIRRIGGHEQWGAIHSAEIGDGTLECRDTSHTLQMIDMFLNDGEFLCEMCANIVRNKENGVYNGAYEAVKIAMSMKDNG